ncbi:MAG: hypothetical protein RMY28_037265 [Nostoc sp. ChiSLP01]|nr:hypothetical protein [Nostoc sp. CmiSLP01]MDZ8287374.1 hypothetical protein [Nostoc sp. ChiSLP01]
MTNLLLSCLQVVFIQLLRTIYVLSGVQICEDVDSQKQLLSQLFQPSSIICVGKHLA